MERRAPEEDPPAEIGGLDSLPEGGADVSAIVAISEATARPHDEQKRLLRSISLEHDGQRIVESSPGKKRYYNIIRKICGFCFRALAEAEQ